MKGVRIGKTKVYTPLIWKLLISADPSKKMIEGYIGISDVYEARMDKETVAEYVLTKINKSVVELKNIAVDEKFQGRGIGKRLIADAVDRAKKSGYSILEVGTGNSSFLQLAFYQKCGFRIFGVKKNFFTKNYSEKIIENGIELKDMIMLSRKI